MLDETITLFFRRLPFNSARASLESIQAAIKDGYVILERITAERFERAIELRFKFQDKPRISLTDLTSMAVMRERDITSVLTEDEHFSQVGLGFQRCLDVHAT